MFYVYYSDVSAVFYSFTDRLCRGAVVSKSAPQRDSREVSHFKKLWSYLRHFADSGICRNNFKHWPPEHWDQVLELRSGEVIFPLHALHRMVEHLCWITTSSILRDLLLL